MPSEKVIDPMLVPHLKTIAVAIANLTTILEKLPQNIIPTDPKQRANILNGVREVESRAEALLASLRATAGNLK